MNAYPTYYYHLPTTNPINSFYRPYVPFNYSPPYSNPSYSSLENGELNVGDRALIPVVLEGSVKVAEGIVTIKKALDIINPGRSAVLIFQNKTNLTLRKIRHNLEHGAFAHTPEGEIPPNHTLIFSARDSEWSIGTGTEGTVTYAGEGIEVTLYWDVPFIGGNECNITITGSNANKYRTIHTCGGGNKNAEMRYELAPADAAPGVPTARRLTSSNNSKNIASLSRILSSLEVWWIGANGSVQDAFWYEGQNWQLDKFIFFHFLEHKR